jgi:hypothetical protein
MIALYTAASRNWRVSLWAAALAAVPLLLGSAAWTEGNATNSPALRFIKAIPVKPTPQNIAGGMFSFDISWVDPANGLYYLGDRSNSAIDVVDTTGAFTGKPDSLFGQIGGSFNGKPIFSGDTGSTATSGPDGVTAAFPCIFAGDGTSTAVSFNAAVSFTTPVSQVSTGGLFRVDEMAFDPKDRVLIAANNADTPPFATLFSVDSSCRLTIAAKTVFTTAASGVNATNGAEQPAWEPITGRFYTSIPEIGGPGGGGPNGAVVRTNPLTGVVEAVYPVNYCQPGGLTVGPNGDLMVGCSTVFDTSGNACSTVVPAPSPTGAAAAHPATCAGSAFPQDAVCNPGRGCTGNALVSVPGVGGGDEIFYNSGDGNYYVSAGNNPIGPTIGVVASGRNATQPNTLTQLVPTLSPIPAVAKVHGAGTVHSIAASAANNHVYVPLPANNSYPNCATGCIAVFSAQ